MIPTKSTGRQKVLIDIMEHNFTTEIALAHKTSWYGFTKNK